MNMNIDRDKLIEMAKEAGFELSTLNTLTYSDYDCDEELTKFASLVSAHAITSMQGDSEPITLIALKSAEFQKRITVLEDLLASAYNIANRNGENTHWQRFAGQLHINGISPITPKTFKILPSDFDDRVKGVSDNANAKDGWIDCSVELPELVNSEPESIGNGFRMPANKSSNRCLVVVNGNVTESKLIWREDYPEKTTWAMLGDGVTHWQYLPPPPKAAAISSNFDDLDSDIPF